MGVVKALDPSRWDLGFRVNKDGDPEGNTVTVDIPVSSYTTDPSFGECKKVTNKTSDKDYFIPTKTKREWDAFKDAVDTRLAPNLTLSDCACSASDCTSVSCSTDQATCEGGGCNWAGGTCSCLSGSTCDPLNECKTGETTCDGTTCDETGDKVANTDCAGTCKVCDGSGSCGNTVAGQDYQSECSPYTCTNYISGWSGSNCLKYSSPTENNGDCFGNGSCATVANSCIGSGTVSASCGSAECVDNTKCVAGQPSSSNDDPSEICFTSGQNGCAAGKECDASGECVAVYLCAGCAKTKAQILDDAYLIFLQDVNLECLSNYGYSLHIISVTEDASGDCIIKIGCHTILELEIRPLSPTEYCDMPAP